MESQIETESVALAQEVIRAMERNIAHLGAYPEWTVGLTANPDRSHKQHDFPAFWRFWYTETPEAARKVNAYFLEKGMKPDPDETPEKYPTFVYLF